MSKDYKGALYFLMTETHEYNGGKIIPIAQNAIDDLQELVDRNEPMIPHFLKFVEFLEPSVGICECGAQVHRSQNYCDICGQKLDWEVWE